MRTLSLLAVTATAVAASFASPASAAVECKPPVSLGPCYVHDPDGSYTCTWAYASVTMGAGTIVQGCLGEWQPVE